MLFMHDHEKEQGQGLVEYALILVLIAVVVIAVLTLLGSQVREVFAQISCALQGGDWTPAAAPDGEGTCSTGAQALLNLLSFI
jgi:pilus assembly protein Flp/PilA